MKKIALNTLIVAAITAIGLSGCKKFLNEEVNPNSPSVTTLPLALSGAEKIMADIPNGVLPVSGGGSYSYYGYWVGCWAVSSGFIVQPNLSEYVLTTGDFQVWNDLYLNLSNINNLQNLAIAQASPNYQAIALVMSAYDFEQLVDNYNDVPYSQAFSSTNLFPAYDKGADVYAGLIKQCDAAIALIQKNTSASTPGSDDIIFGGNMTGWAKFANTLKLRLIMRQSNLQTFSATAADMSSTLSVGFLDGTTQAVANPGYSLNDANGGQESAFWHAYGISAGGTPEDILVKANTYSITMLHGFNDPRLTSFYTTVTEPTGTANAGATVVKGLYLGDPQLSNDTNSAGDLSNVGPGLLQSAAQNAVVFSGAESLFLQAEAVNDKIITIPSQTAQSLYQAAITASFEATGAQYPDPSKPGSFLTPDQSAVIYYNQPIANVGWAASSANLEQAIITQKYIALNGYGVFEEYNEWRRTGYPAGVPKSEDPATIGPIPRRILYPQVEYNTNAANVAKEGTIDQFTSRIFWDTTPSN